MALFGESRDISFIRKINRELMGNIISQQCVYYKYDIEQTPVNIYGEADNKRIFKEPLLVNALIKRNDQEFSGGDNVDLKWDITFAFLRDDLVDKNLVPEIGDIIMYNESYYEIVNLVKNQYFMGKDPDYPYDGVLDRSLGNFGYNVSIVCQTVYVSPDNLDIIRTR